MKVKRSFITFAGLARDNQAMLDISNEEMARRVRLALTAAPRGAQARIAAERKITEQAVSNWKKSGTVDKAHIPALARHTGRRMEYFLDPLIGDAHSELSSQSVELDSDTMASAIVSLKESAERSGLILDFYAAAAALTFAYEQRAKHPKKMTRAEYAVFDEHIRQRLLEGTGNEEFGRGKTESGAESFSGAAAKSKKAGFGR